MPLRRGGSRTQSYANYFAARSKRACNRRVWIAAREIKACAFILLFFAVIPAKAAGDLYMRYFGGVASGKACYARYYDNAHLKAHPKQTVRRIEVDFDANSQEGVKENTQADFLAGIGFMLKRSREWYGQSLFCKTVGDHFECFLEADGGRIRLVPRGEALRLEVVGGPGSDIHAEGKKDFGEFGEYGGDDRVFLLPRADRKLCDASTQ